MITDVKRAFRQLLILLVIVLLAVGVRYFVKKHESGGKRAINRLCIHIRRFSSQV
jgi:hypothetical protein